MNTNRYRLTDQHTRSRATACLADLAKRMFSKNAVEALRNRVISVHKFLLKDGGKYSLVVNYPTYPYDTKPFHASPKKLLVHHPGAKSLISIEPDIVQLDSIQHQGVVVFSSVKPPGLRLAEEYASCLRDIHGRPFKVEAQGTITLMSPQDDGRSATHCVFRVK